MSRLGRPDSTTIEVFTPTDDDLLTPVECRTSKMLCDFFAQHLQVQIGNLGLLSADRFPHMDGSRPSVASERRSFFSELSIFCPILEEYKR